MHRAERMWDLEAVVKCVKRVSHRFASQFPADEVESVGYLVAGEVLEKQSMRALMDGPIPQQELEALVIVSVRNKIIDMVRGMQTSKRLGVNVPFDETIDEWMVDSDTPEAIAETSTMIEDLLILSMRTQCTRVFSSFVLNDFDVKGTAKELRTSQSEVNYQLDKLCKAYKAQQQP